MLIWKVGLISEKIAAAIFDDELAAAQADVADLVDQPLAGLVPSRSRSSADTLGDGDSWNIFWKRRWIDDSISGRKRMLPLGVAEKRDFDVVGVRKELLEKDAAAGVLLALQHVGRSAPGLRAGNRRRGYPGRPSPSEA